MKIIIPHFVSKERLVTLASEFLGMNVNGEGYYHVESEDYPYEETEFSKDLHISRLKIGGRAVIESIYHERYYSGLREVIRKETRLIMNYERSLEFFRYIQEKVPYKFKGKS